jgi:putative membrane protein
VILHETAPALARVAVARLGRPLPPFAPSRWEYHDSTLVGLAVLTLLYLYAVGPYRRRAGVAGRAGAWRVASFFSGLAVTFFALNGPIHDLSDSYLFSVHMVQHLMLTQLAPPLLLLGLPAFVLEPLARPRWVKAVGRVLSRPPVAFALYSVTFSAWHLQPAYDLMMRDHDVHIFTHVLFMVTAVIMWWPVLSPLREFPRLSPPGAMAYLFLLGVPMMLVASLITLSDDVLYPWYASAPRVWGLSPLADQKLGGLIMWIPGGMFYWLVMSVVFFRWAAREQRLDDAEAARP